MSGVIGEHLALLVELREDNPFREEDAALQQATIQRQQHQQQQQQQEEGREREKLNKSGDAYDGRECDQEKDADAEDAEDAHGDSIVLSQG